MKSLYRQVVIIFNLLLFVLGVAILQSCTTTYVARTTEPAPEYAPPPWAPPYDDVNEVRYYYIPDIEMYYDVYNRQYVYNDMGRWVYTQNLPPVYASYDLNSSFVVVLNRDVREPWHHHNEYVTHYPRNYYQREYGNRDREAPVRGFNENRRTVIYNRSGDDRRNNNSRPSTRETSREMNRETSRPSTRETSRPSTRETSRQSTRESNQRTTNQSAPVERHDRKQDASRQQERNTNTAPSRDSRSSQPAATQNSQPARTESSQPQSRRTESSPAPTQPTQSAQPVQQRSAPAPASSRQQMNSAPAPQPQPSARENRNAARSAPAPREERHREQRKPDASDNKDQRRR